MKKYLLFESKESKAYAFIGENHPQPKRFLEADSELIWSVEAPSYEEAATQMHEYLGWEPYEAI